MDSMPMDKESICLIFARIVYMLKKMINAREDETITFFKAELLILNHRNKMNVIYSVRIKKLYA